MRARGIQNALTIDVEDYFMVSAYDAVVSREDWGSHEARVGDSTGRVLDLLARHGVRATFFVLGWVAERFPHLIREIHARGHEVASHGYDHRLVHSLTPEQFRADLRRASAAIEAATGGARVLGFRAPSFSITEGTLWAFDVLREEGYRFSSSVYPVRHDRYGIPNFPRRPVRLVGRDGRGIWEFPMTTWRVFGLTLPVAGGGWLRFFPLPITERAVASANGQGLPANVYVHPWELDPSQPRIRGLAPVQAWRHHLNLDRVEERLDRLLSRFPFGTVSSCLRMEVAA